MEDFDDKVLKIYELGYRDAHREQDYDPQGHEETYALQQDIRKLQSKKAKDFLDMMIREIPRSMGAINSQLLYDDLKTLRLMLEVVED